MTDRPGLTGAHPKLCAVVGMVADGMSEEEILAANPDLEREDIREAVRYSTEGQGQDQGGDPGQS